jgi:hypothetical protein
MMINGKLRDFVCHVIAKGQITLGDVRRLQRGYLRDGITNGEELEMLISLNANLLRADKAWPQWLLSVVTDFVTNREACEPSFDASGKWADRLLAASATKLGRRIARQIRRELSRPRAMQVTRPEECIQSCDVQEPDPREDHPDDCSPRIDLGTEPPLCDGGKDLARSRPARIGHQTIPRTKAFTDATHGWRLANYVRHVQRSDLINFQSSRVSLVLAPCL